MRERFKSHDYGRTSLSRFQWSEPQTLLDSNDLSIPPTLEVSAATKQVQYLFSLGRAHAAECRCGKFRAQPRTTRNTSYGKRSKQQLQTSDFASVRLRRTSPLPGNSKFPPADRRCRRRGYRTTSTCTAGRYLSRIIPCTVGTSLCGCCAIEIHCVGPMRRPPTKNSRSPRGPHGRHSSEPQLKLRTKDDRCWKIGIENHVPIEIPELVLIQIIVNVETENAWQMKCEN